MSTQEKLFPTLYPNLKNQVLEALPFDDTFKTIGLKPVVNLSQFGFLYSNPRTGDLVQYRSYQHTLQFKIRHSHRMVAYEDVSMEFYYSFGTELTVRVVIQPSSQPMNSQARILETDKVFQISIKELGDPSEEEIEVAIFDLIVRESRLMWPKGELDSVRSISAETFEQIVREFLEYNTGTQFKELMEIYQQLIEKRNK